MDLTVGALSAATGVPVATLRTWAARYDFPPSQRTAGGHRLYDQRAVDLVKLALGALGRGQRPAQVFRASVAELRGFESNWRPDNDTDAWVERARALDPDGLDMLLRRAAAASLLDFATGPAPLFLRRLGELWASGAIEVRHEHFGATALGAVLEDGWRRAARGAQGPAVVLATLPGQKHGIGLHLAAVLFAAAGWRPVMLGTEAPEYEIVLSAQESRAAAVGISLAEGGDGAGLVSLERALPPGCTLIAGGRGAPAGRGLGLSGLRDWLATRSSGSP